MTPAAAGCGSNGKPETNIGALCRELGIAVHALSTCVAHRGSAGRFTGPCSAGSLIRSRSATTKEHLHLLQRDFSVLVGIDRLENFGMSRLEFLKR
jgi:hypothetical protein